MNRLRRSGSAGSSFPLLLVAVAIGALLLRVAYVVALRHHALSGDGYSYHLGAIALRDGHGFVDPLNKALPPSAHHPPAWTLVLAITPALGMYSLLAHQLFASMVGVVTVVVVGLAGRRLASDRGGLIAAGIAAVYPGFWLYEQELLSETLLLLGVAVITIAAYRYQAEPTRWRAVTVGALCGVLALIRSEQLLLIVVLLVPLVLGWRWRNITRHRVVSLLLAGLAAVLVIAPWTLYNLDRLDEPVLLSTSYGSELAQGNCKTVYSGELLGYYDFACLGTTAREAARRGLKDPFADSTLRRQAITYMREHAGRLPEVSLARQGRAWGLFRPMQTADLQALFSKDLTWPRRAAFFCYWALLVAASIGGVVLRRRRISLLPLLAPVVVAIVAIAITYGDPRLRAGAEVPLVLLASVGIARLSTRRRPEATGGAASDPDVPAAPPVSVDAPA